MVGKVPREVKMEVYGRFHSEKRTFFSRNLKGELLSANNRSKIYTFLTVFFLTKKHIIFLSPNHYTITYTVSAMVLKNVIADC
jgi:hypothetical protein